MDYDMEMMLPQGSANMQKYLMARHGREVNSDIYHARFKFIVFINSIFGSLVI